MKLARQNPPVFPRQTVEQALTALLEQHLFHLGRWEEKARSWDDIEGVHQMRVALRRMRAILRIFRPAMARELTDPWRATMRDFAGQLGPARDLDVFIAESLGAVAGRLPLAGGDGLQRLASKRREAAYVDVRAVLDGGRYRTFKQSFADWLNTGGWRHSPTIADHRGILDQNVASFSRRVLKKQRKRVLRQGRSTTADVPEELHRLRIDCKNLRYAAECFAPLYPDMEHFIAHLKGLQDVLGAMNDVSVTRQLLDELLAEVSDSELLQYGAGLIGWRYCEYERLRGSFDSRWKEFRHTRKPW